MLLCYIKLELLIEQGKYVFFKFDSVGGENWKQYKCLWFTIWFRFKRWFSAIFMSKFPNQLQATNVFHQIQRKKKKRKKIMTINEVNDFSRILQFIDNGITLTFWEKLQKKKEKKNTSRRINWLANCLS